MPGWNYPGRAYPGQSVDSPSGSTGTGSFDAPSASFEGAGLVSAGVRVFLRKRITGPATLTAPAPTIRATGRVRNRLDADWLAPEDELEGEAAVSFAVAMLGSWT